MHRKSLADDRLISAETTHLRGLKSTRRLRGLAHLTHLANLVNMVGCCGSVGVWLGIRYGSQVHQILLQFGLVPALALRFQGD